MYTCLRRPDVGRAADYQGCKESGRPFSRCSSIVKAITDAFFYRQNSSNLRHTYSTRTLLSREAIGTSRDLTIVKQCYIQIKGVNIVYTYTFQTVKITYYIFVFYDYFNSGLQLAYYPAGISLDIRMWQRRRDTHQL